MNTKIKRSAFAALVAAALVAPPAADAHVTLQPDEAPAGGFTRLDVRVPNERDNAGTTKVEVQFPPGFVFASYEPVPGWTVDVKKRKAAEPVEEEGETFDEEVATITWTGNGSEGVIPPGAFQDFGLSVGIPDTPGEELTFKAIQTYENGEVVRWIGAPDSESPAPVVSVTEAEEDHHSSGSDDEESEGSEESASADDDGDFASKGLGIAGLVVGGLGLLAGGASLVRSRK